MADANVQARIGILIDSTQATAQLRALQAQINTLNKSVVASSGTAAAQQAALNKALMDGAAASKMFTARIVPVTDGVQNFTNALERNKLSLGQYTRYAASQLPGMSRVFKREFEMMNRVAETNVKRLQTQYTALGQSVNGVQKALALTPTQLDAYSSRAAIAAQRQMLFNRMIDMGSTSLLNWGKNTQWAGRQLMVGFSIPLAALGAVAAKTFMEIDKGSIAFRRVYGDLSTTTAEMERNLDAVKSLGTEYTKYGLKLSETIELASDVAATGAKNESLLAATEQTLRLATLGLMQYDEALQATIALQTAFDVSNQDLASTIDFLNVVENETILTMQDMAAAIPRVAPVVKGLGGDVKDLAVFMTAMREGGVTAEQGANALKSGLGRLINPTKAAQEQLAKFNINLNSIIQANRGDLMGIIQEFGTALSTLGEFEQQQVLEKVFGKYQYARLGALFKNISNDASQAQRTMELTNMTVEDLASISERELGKIEEATSTKFTAAVEQLKLAIAPIGETFLKALTPAIKFITDLAEKFNNLPDGIKNAIAIAVGAIGGLGPIILMTVGLIANGVANIVKLIQTMRRFFARLRGDSSAFNHLTVAEQEATAAAASLEGRTGSLTGKLVMQQEAVSTLIGLYQRLATSMTGVSSAMVGNIAGGAKSTVVRSPGSKSIITGPGGIPMAKGGVVPGTGNKDTVPAVLTPGESVVTKDATSKYGPIIQAMNDGSLQGFSNGVVDAKQSSTTISGGRQMFYPMGAVFAPGNTPTAQYGMSKEFFRRGPEFPRELMSTAVGGGVGLEKLDNPSLRATQKLYDEYHAEVKRDVPKIIAALRQTEREMIKNGENIDSLEDITRKAKPRIQSILQDMERRGGRAARSAVALRETMYPTEAMTTARGESRVLTAKYRGGEFESMSTGRRRRSPLQRYIGAAYGKIYGRERPSGRTFAHMSSSKILGPMAAWAGGGLSTGKSPLPAMKEAEAKKLIERQSQSLQGATAAAGQRLGMAVAKGGDQGLGNSSPSIKAQQSVTQYVDGLEVGAAKNTGDAAKAGKVVGNSFAASVKQSILAGKTAPGLLPQASPKEQYKAAQSASRREAYNIKQMQKAGMTDAQIIRQLDRLEKSKQKQLAAEKRAADIAQRNATIAQQNAAMAQKTGTAMGAEAKARRGMLSRASGYFGAEVEPGVTRGQRLRSRVGAAGGGAVMGLMGLSMAASMAGGAVGEMAQKVMPVTMGLMGLQMILPMLSNPFGIATIAIAGLAAAAVKTRMDLDSLAKSSAEAGANIGGFANGLKILEDATGFVAPKPEDRLFRFTEEDRAAMSEFGSYFESEAGSKFIQDLKEATSEERYQKVSALLAQGIATGLEEEKAKAFGNAIAEATGDAILASNLARDFANQIFESGSQRLIELEQQRFDLAPDVSAPTVDLGGRQVASNVFTQLSKELFSGGNIQVPVLDIEAPGWMRAFIKGPLWIGQSVFSRVEGAKIEKAAQGLGFALQSIENLSNAEAVLEQERINGSITLDEYRSRLEELQNVQKQQSEYIGQIMSIGADAGAMAQALGSQLSLKGFSDEQVKKVTEEFNPNKLAQKFFDQDFGRLDEAQADFVEEVFTRTLSGITPENAAQRLDDIDRIYAGIAEDVVNGIYDSVEQGAQVSGFAGAISQSFGVSGISTGGLGEATGVSPAERLAKNLQDANNELMKFGTDSEEVLVELMRFEDVDFASSLLQSEDDILRVGSAIKELAQYENIDIEFVLKSETDPRDVAKAIETISRIKIDPRVFGNLGFEADKIVQSFMELGVEVDDIPQKLSKSVAAIDKFGKSAVDKLGNIKPKIVPQIVADVFGTSAETSAEISNALNSAFPDSLTPIDLAIILSLAGNEAAMALLSDPAAIAAARRGDTSLTRTVRVGSETFRRQINLAPLAPLQLTGGGTAANKKPPGDTSGGSSGGGTDPLKEMQDSIMERLRLYTNIEKVSQKLKNAKDKFEKIMSEVGYGGSLVAKLRKQGLSEMLIADIIAKGVGFTKKMLKNLQESKKLNQQLVVGMAGEQISNLVGERRQARAKVKAAGRLRSENFTSEQISDILSDPAVAETLAGLEVGSKAWEDYIKQLNKSRNAANAAKAALDPVAAALDNVAKAQEEFDLVSDVREAKFQREFGRLDREYAPRIKAQEEVISQLEKQRDEIQKQIDAIEELNSADQRIIRDKQRQIELLERQKQTIQDQIDEIEYQNELDQRKISSLQREDELRGRVSDALNHELEIMSQQEDKIRESYEKRFAALDKIAGVNDYIINQQKQQLDLSRSISEGDIYAATAAAQEMRASSSQFASQQLRTGLETSMENQIAGLRTSGGLSREEAEQQILDIQEQSYQTSLMIREIEDDIYDRNLAIIPLKDSIRNIDKEISGYQLQIRDLQDNIYDRETQILNIQTTRLDPINKQLAVEQEKSASLEDELQARKDAYTVDNLTYQQHTDMLDAQMEENRLIEANIKASARYGKQVGQVVDQWGLAAKNIAEANRLARDLATNVNAAAANDITVLEADQDITPTERREAIEARNAARDADLAAIESRRQERVSAARQRAIDFQRSMTGAYAGGMIKKMGMGGMLKKYDDGGPVSGPGGRDSVLAKLMPGEFVIRKAMVKKYGEGMMKDINLGSFVMPKYKMPSENGVNGINPITNMTSINAPVYNTYDMSFNINGTNASADEVANRVMFKMEQAKLRSIRSNRGY